MSNLGMGAMIGLLTGNEETVNAIKSSIGKAIRRVELIDNALRFEFEDGSKLSVWDGGQSCCEERYMVTADRLDDFIGATLLGFELKEAPPESTTYGDHEVQFLDVQTSRGVFQCANHNEHNGYYGGFWIKASGGVA